MAQLATQVFTRTDGWLSQSKKCKPQSVEFLPSGNALMKKTRHDVFISSIPIPDIEELLYAESLYPTLSTALDEIFNLTSSSKNPVMMLNNIRLVIEILHPIVHHPRVRDKGLIMTKGPSIDDKHPCYLLGNRVYSTASKKQFSNLKKRYQHLVQCLLKPLSSALGPEPWVLLSTQKILPELASAFEFGYKLNPVQIYERLDPFISMSSDEPEKYLTAYHNAQLLDRQSISPLAMSKKKAKLLDRSISTLQLELEIILRPIYPGCQLTIYGGCLSHLSVGSDVDISVSIPELKQIKLVVSDYEVYRQELIRVMKNIQKSLMKRRTFSDVIVVSKARIPVIKGRAVRVGNPFSSNGSLCFDLSFFNDIAVANSSLIREYSLVDERVKLLMLAVKAWAKRHKISSAADRTISSYAWINLVIFFLQCIDFVPNLQSPELMRKHGFTPSKCHLINEMQTAFLTCDLIRSRKRWNTPSIFYGTPVSFLLCGFFSFYADVFPHYFMTVAIREGKCSMTKFSSKTSRLWRMSIEDPFETYNSPSPHDLGMHLNEKGQMKITNAFRNSLLNMKKFFRGDIVSLDLF